MATLIQVVNERLVTLIQVVKERVVTLIHVVVAIYLVPTMMMVFAAMLTLLMLAAAVHINKMVPLLKLVVVKVTYQPAGVPEVRTILAVRQYHYTSEGMKDTTYLIQTVNCLKQIIQKQSQER